MMFFRRRRQTDFEEEIRAHLELEAERLRKLGVESDEAALVARRNFGNVGIAQDRFHEAQSFGWLHDFARDIRYAARILRRARRFSIAVILTLALGIGANSAMFAIVNAVLFRPLPYPDSRRLLSISRTEDGQDIEVLDDRTFRALLANGAPSLESVAASHGVAMVVNTSDGPRQVSGSSVTSRFFAVFGFAPIFGRTFTDAEDRPGGAPVVVLSEQMWRGVFAADSAILGKSVDIDNVPRTVIGVMPAALTSAKRAQFWLPLGLQLPAPGRTMYYGVVGRMRINAGIETVRAEVGTVAQRTIDEMSAKHRAQRVYGSAVMTLQDRRFGDSKRALILLFSTVGILLVIACANLANLSLARAARREREFAVRATLGASRSRIVRYVLCECLVLSSAGALLGALLAAGTVGYFVRISPGSLANAEGIRVDATTLGFTLVIALATAVLFGLIPALRAARGDVSLVGTSRIAGSRREHLLRRGLIVAQLATALVLLTGAALVTKTLARVASIDTGFESENLLVIRPTLGRGRHTAATATVFYQELMSRLRQDPDVRAVTLVDAVPLGGMLESFDDTDATGKRIIVDVVGADPAYLATVGARLVEGRWFTTTDAHGAPAVVVISDALARARFPGRSPLGQTLKLDGAKTIVGVVRDIRQRRLEDLAAYVSFLPLAQSGVGLYESIIVRTRPGSPVLADRVRKMFKAIDPGQVPPTLSTMDERLAENIAPRRFTAVLLAAFAGLAATLAIVGLYGVLSYLVAERTREIGIRVALGADPVRVLRAALGSGMAVTAIGIALGAGAAAFTVRLLRGLVYDMSVYDPWMFAASAALLLGVALFASYIPARRAAAVDPATALRVD
jgi:putative ABC transport system permease protein